MPPKIFNTTIEVDTPPVHVQPDPDIAPSTPVYDYPIDPSTGQYVSVIKTGECPEPPLQNTTAQPETFEIESPTEDTAESKEE